MTPRIQHRTENGIETKRCCTCENYKSLDMYTKSSTSWDKLRPECKDCNHQRNINNKSNITAYNKVYWAKTKEVQTKKHKIWVEKNKEHVAKKMHEWFQNNKEYRRQKDKEYRVAHWEHKKKINNEWRKKNYHDMKTNPERKNELIAYKLKSNSARRIREMLKQSKSERTLTYVGCSLEDLKKHLQLQFEEGMMWENYGVTRSNEPKTGWHIDHIIPCAAFNLADPFEQRACFYYMNLQPRWAEENIMKSDEFDTEERDEYLEMYKGLELPVDTTLTEELLAEEPEEGEELYS